MHSKKSGQIMTWHNLSARLAPPFCQSDGRWKTRLYLLDNVGKSIVVKVLQTRANASKDALAPLAVAALEELPPMHADEIIRRLTAAAPSIALDTYLTLRWAQICHHAKWARRAGTYSQLWTQTLCPVFGSIDLLKCTNTTALEDAMEELTHRKQKKASMTETERSAWLMLDGVLQYAMQEGILKCTEPPLREIVRKCRRLQSTAASHDLARDSMASHELATLLTVCLARLDESDVYGAMALQILTGLRIPELCALSVSDYIRKIPVSWLEITKAYEQKSHQEPQLTTLLRSPYAYRKIPCSETVETLLLGQIARLKKGGKISSDTPLFRGSDGERLTPEAYKAARNELLTSLATDPANNFLHEGAVLDFLRRANSVAGAGASITHGDLLRNTTAHYLHNNCGLPRDHVAALLGRKPTATYAHTYVDWSNELALLYLAATIQNGWHNQFLSTQEQTLPLRQSVQITADVLPGSTILLETQYQLEISVFQKKHLQEITIKQKETLNT